jgi:hypothetical protein
VTNILPDATKNALLDSAVAGGLVTTGTHMGLHTAFPPTTGNETTGGSPAYARQPIVWATASAGSKAITGSETFDVPATTVRAVGIWSQLATGGGTLVASLPAGSSARIAISVPDATAVTANTIYSEAHGLVAGNSVLFWDTHNAGLPAGISEDTEYFVIATGLTADAFQVSATLGGAAIDITDEGVGDCQKFTPEVFAAQGTYQVSAFTVTLPG